MAMTDLTLHGIRNCDSVRKARAWLDGRGIAYAFHDYKVVGVDAGKLSGWADRLGWEALLNRAGTTLRKLPEEDKIDLDRDKAVALMTAHPSLIKRPVLERGDVLLVGFTPERYASALSLSVRVSLV